MTTKFKALSLATISALAMGYNVLNVSADSMDASTTNIISENNMNDEVRNVITYTNLLSQEDIERHENAEQYNVSTMSPDIEVLNKGNA